MIHKPTPIFVYVSIYVALLVLLVLTVLAAGVDLDHTLTGLNFGVTMLIATIKAILVGVFFMHLRDASRLTWTFALAGILWLAILLGLTFNDYATRDNDRREIPSELRP